MDIMNEHQRWSFPATAVDAIRGRRNAGDLADPIVIEEIGGPEIYVEGNEEDLVLLRLGT